MRVLKKIARGVFAALSTPEAVKHEKSLLTIVLVRLAILVPSGAVVIDKLVELLK